MTSKGHFEINWPSDGGLTGHEKGFSPVWVLTCASNSCLVKKALGHVSHFLFRMSKWRLFLWSIREETELKELPHSEHKCAFSPVWTGAWTANWWARAKALGHISHLYGRLPTIYTIIEPYLTIRNYNYIAQLSCSTKPFLPFNMCTCILLGCCKAIEY